MSAANRQKQIGQRRFAGTVGADDGVDVVTKQIERHIIDSRQATEFFRQVFSRKQKFIHG